jgi:hypothetical protein
MVMRTNPLVGDEGYRIDFLRIRSDKLWESLQSSNERTGTEQDGNGSALRYFVFGEYDIVTISRAKDAKEWLEPPEVPEEALSIHVMPVFRWKNLGTGIFLDDKNAWNYPILGLFALKTQMPWNPEADAPPLRCTPNEISSRAEYLAREITNLNIKAFLLCGSIGFFEIILLLQTNDPNDIGETLQCLHGMEYPQNSGDPAFCSIHPVVAIRAEALKDTAGNRIIQLPEALANTAPLEAHFCISCRPGKLCGAIRLLSPIGPIELMVARSDLEVVMRYGPENGANIHRIALHSLRLFDRADEISRVRTALSFPNQVERTEVE